MGRRGPGHLRGSIAACLLGVGVLLANASSAEVIVLSPDGDASIDRVLKGLREGLSGYAQRVRYLSLALSDLATPLRAAASDTVFVGVGQGATEEVLRLRSQPTLVGCLVQSSDVLPRGEGVASIPSEVAPEAQAAWLRRLYPQGRRVGLLYDPERNARQVARLTEALRQVGLQTVATPVRSPTALPAALSGLGKKVDVILGLQDRTVFTAQTAKAILLHSFRARIPVIGLSDAWVKAGALYAIEPDYEDIGRRCSLAARRLTGNAAELSAQPARLLLSVNLRTARHMRVDWPKEVLQMAQQAHE